MKRQAKVHILKSNRETLCGLDSRFLTTDNNGQAATCKCCTAVTKSKKEVTKCQK